MSGTDPAPTGNFEVYSDHDSCWCDLVRGNGDLLLRSRPLRSLADASSLVAAMRDEEARLRGRMTAEGRFYYTAELGDDVLATSPMHEFPAERDRALELARATIPLAVVVFIDEHRAS